MFLSQGLEECWTCFDKTAPEKHELKTQCFILKVKNDFLSRSIGWIRLKYCAVLQHLAKKGALHICCRRIWTGGSETNQHRSGGILGWGSLSVYLTAVKALTQLSTRCFCSLSSGPTLCTLCSWSSCQVTPDNGGHLCRLLQETGC